MRVYSSPWSRASDAFAAKGKYEERSQMLLTIYLAIVILAAVTVMMLSAVAFIQDERMFSSAPEEVRKLIRPRKTELFYGARTIGWALLIFSILMILRFQGRTVPCIG
jgi:hypothetical protein